MGSLTVLQPYVQLQRDRLHRWMRETGVPVWLGYLLGVALFVAGSIYLFEKTAYAAYFYALLSLQACLALGDSARASFLRTHYDDGVYLLLRRLENSLVVLPFFLFLLIKGALVLALFVMLAAWLLAFWSGGSSSSLVIPTPFSGRPFEFTVGFRRNWYLVLLVYCLVIIGCWVGNFNLGVVAILFLFLIFSGYYSWQEPVVCMWYHLPTPAAFLRKKAAVAWMHSSIAVIPAALLLFFFFPANLPILLLVLITGYLFLGTILLAKYAAYPESIGLKQGILIVLGLYPPILLVLVAFYFYGVAKKQLNVHL